MGQKQLVGFIIGLLLKQRFLWECKIWDTFVKKISVLFIITSSKLNPKQIKILTICDTYNCGYVPHS